MEHWDYVKWAAHLVQTGRLDLTAGEWDDLRTYSRKGRCVLYRKLIEADEAFKEYLRERDAEGLEWVLDEMQREKAREEMRSRAASDPSASWNKRMMISPEMCRKMQCGYWDVCCKDKKMDGYGMIPCIRRWR